MSIHINKLVALQTCVERLQGHEIVHSGVTNEMPNTLYVSPFKDWVTGLTDVESNISADEMRGLQALKTDHPELEGLIGVIYDKVRDMGLARPIEGEIIPNEVVRNYLLNPTIDSRSVNDSIVRVFVGFGGEDLLGMEGGLSADKFDGTVEDIRNAVKESGDTAEKVSISAVLTELTKVVDDYLKDQGYEQLPSLQAMGAGRGL